MFEKVSEILAQQLGISKDKITLESEIIKDLGADSLDVFELLVALQNETGKTIPDDQITTLKTVGDVVTVLENL